MKSGKHIRLGCAAGFSILEMLIVLAIVSMVAAVARPLFHGVPDAVKFRASVRDAINAFKSARVAAITRNTEAVMTIDLESRSLSSPSVANAIIPADIEIHLKVAAIEQQGASRGGVRFYSDGSSTGGELILTMRQRTSSICVNWLTGIAREQVACQQRPSSGGQQ
jgi:general secretion pathway protein H